jgi:DNA-binding transcriptional regulator YbjK
MSALMKKARRPQLPRPTMEFHSPYEQKSSDSVRKVALVTLSDARMRSYSGQKEVVVEPNLPLSELKQPGTPDTKARDRIAALAFDLACSEGLPALTNRKLAEYADISPSSISHHWGGIGPLRLHVAVMTHEAAAKWRSTFQVMLDSGLVHPTLPGLLIAALTDLGSNNRGLGLLHGELLASREAADFRALEREALDFWASAFRSLGGSDIQIESWIDLFYGLVPLVLLDRSAVSLASWLPVLVQRFDDRLEDRAVTYDAPFPFPPLAPVPEGPTAASAQKILNAVVTIAADDGMDALTHRSVAQRAGVSVAATTYSFANKADLLIGAVEELRRRGQAIVNAHLSKDTTSGAVLAVDGHSLTIEMRATAALQTTVARNDELQIVRPLLRDMHGPLGLVRLRHEGFDVDRLDAVIWSTLMFGMIYPLRMPTQDIKAALEARTALHRLNLFGSYQPHHGKPLKDSGQAPSS